MYSRRHEQERANIAHQNVLDKLGQELPDKTITIDEVTCAKCGFKARYTFIRCPECNEVRK